MVINLKLVFQKYILIWQLPLLEISVSLETALKSFLGALSCVIFLQILTTKRSTWIPQKTLYLSLIICWFKYTCVTSWYFTYLDSLNMVVEQTTVCLLLSKSQSKHCRAQLCLCYNNLQINYFCYFYFHALKNASK